MERILWVYWEMAPGVHSLPPHIALCREIMERNARDYRLNVVTPENIRTYLPDLPDRLSKIALKPRGRIQKYFGRRSRRAAAIAVRADYIRAFLLERYGGIYIDSDAIVLGDLSEFFAAVERVGFTITQRESFGKSHVSINFYGSAPGNSIITEYTDFMRWRITGNLDHTYNEVGADVLTPIVNRHLSNVAIIPERLIQPVTYEDADAKFASTTLELADVVAPEARVFMLYNHPFRRGGSMELADREQLINGNTLLSKVFRHALASG